MWFELGELEIYIERYEDFDGRWWFIVKIKLILEVYYV